jgi:hypothetical protein
MVKVKVTLVQTLRLCTRRTAHRESRGIALLFHDHGTRRGEGSASRPGRSSPPGKTRHPLCRTLGGPHDPSSRVKLDYARKLKNMCDHSVDPSPKVKLAPES